MQFFGKCFCTTCKRALDGVIEVDDHVWLARRCVEHGSIRTMLYTDPQYFKAACAAASSIPQRCLIAEVTERCDVGCATCSASSLASGNEKRVGALIQEIFTRAALTGADVIALSGGEPLMRTDIWEIIDSLSAGFRKIVLITSGRGFETKPDILRAIAARRDVLEIYLQFDSLDDNVLRTLRTSQTTAALRKERLQLAIATGAATTAVCVVPPQSDERDIGELARFCLERGAHGITFQPLRQLGRFPQIAPTDARLTTVDHIQTAALRALGVDGYRATPFIQQPFDISVALVRGTTAVSPDKFFQLGDETASAFRVATSSYWDFTNYIEPLATSGPHYFFVDRDVPLNARYFPNLESQAKVSASAHS